MKNLINSLLILSVILLISCGSENKESGLPTIDLTKSYPKEEIILQDIADVEYVPLETRDDVLLSSSAKIDYLAKDRVVISNRIEGDIFLFDGAGKLLSKFNHKGQGAEEYIRIKDVLYNPPTQEIFLLTKGKPENQILVYDMQGALQRKIPLKSQEGLRSLTNFDAKRFLAYEEPNFLPSKSSAFEELKKEVKVRNKTPMFLISKETGLIDTIKKFHVPNRKTDAILKYDGSITFYYFGTNNITKVDKGFVLDNFFCDTVFQFDKNRNLTPILLKNPALRYKAELPLVLEVLAVSPKFFFVQILEHIAKKRNKRRAKICINRTNNDIVEYSLKNKEIDDKEFKITTSNKLINADELVGLLEEGKLSGKLKEIAKNLKEDDNPVLMKVTFKNN